MLSPMLASLLVAQVGEGHTEEGVDGHADGHHHHEVGMRGIAHSVRQGREEHGHQHDEQRVDQSHERQHRIIHARGLLALLIDEAEKGGLHPEREQHEDECDV